MEAQSFSVKRAEVEFHKFASLGEPERAIAAYAGENRRRMGLIQNHLEFIGPMSPFLEIGANAGHTSYMLANEFGADGFALDLSADALRYGAVLRECWRMSRSPVRVAGDGANLPFRDGSLRMVMAFQFLSQFTDIEHVFREVTRVLAPGGVFFFAEEPIKRALSLRLYRCPYYDTMKPWERKLFDWGLLGYLVRDAIGSHQEESFGIRQNQRFGLKDWYGLLRKHFTDFRCEIFVPERGWGERAVKKLATRLDPHRSEWQAAKLLGGTLAAVCRAPGELSNASLPPIDRFEEFLRCPDCHGSLRRDERETLICGCGYSAPLEDGVHNLLPSAERNELYPGDREDIIDFSRPGHEVRLLDGWGVLEGVFGNKYRWMGAKAAARLAKIKAGPQRLRIRGHASEQSFARGEPVRVAVLANGRLLRQWTLERSGLFVLESAVPDATGYHVEIQASPVWQAPPDDRTFTVNISMIRLVD